MAKLVILNQGMTGRTFDLVVERTTVGRVEDNTFQIADASVSSHHAEILLRGTDIVIRDLNSTNGTFLDGKQITEVVLQSGQTLKFGQVELKLDDGRPASNTSAPAPAPVKKSVESSTMIMPRGVNLNELESGGTRPTGFDASTTFSKKKNKGNKYFLIGGIIFGVIIVVFIIVLLMQTSQPHH
jgi:pSer/pThr/pTyr-binding forkhead associated (FHA) protein